MVPHGPCHHLPQLREAQENSASPPICAACLHNSLPGDQVGARPCRVSSRCTGATPGEPGITAGSGAPAALILLRTESQSKGGLVTCHGKVLSCSALNQKGRRFSTSQALHKPEAPRAPLGASSLAEEPGEPGGAGLGWAEL